VTPVLQVHKGNPDEHELAALTAVLLALTNVDDVPCDRRRARWQRPERAGAFDGPRSWQG
jgi:hypothetical protein